MALVNTTSNSNTTLTDVQKQTRTLARIKAKSTNLFRVVLQGYKDLAGEVQANPDGLSAAEVMTALGDDAANFNTFGEQLNTMLNAVVPGTLPAPQVVAPPAPTTPPATS